MNDSFPKPDSRSLIGRIPLILLSIMLLVGCTGLAGKNRLNKFGEISKSYEQALEMSEYRKALKYLKISKGASPPGLNRLSNVKIVRYKVTQIDVSEDKRSIEQDVELEYFLLDRNVVKTANDHQVWKYEDEGNVWMLQTGLPVFDH